MQIHAALGNIIIPGNQPIEHHCTISVGCFRSRFIVVTKNEISVARSPRKTIGRIKVSQVWEHRIIATTGVITD